MRANLDEIYDETITVINKLDAKDAALKTDTYYATVLRRCMWSDDFASGTNTEGVVTPTTLHKVQIPSGAGKYKPYKEWKSLASKKGSFTLRTGDYVVRGIVKEPVTASTIRTIIADYEPDAFQVRAWQSMSKPKGFERGRGFVMRFADGFALEG